MIDPQNMQRVPSSLLRHAHVQGRCGRWDPLPHTNCTVPSTGTSRSPAYCLLNRFGQHLLPLSVFREAGRVLREKGGGFQHVAGNTGQRKGRHGRGNSGKPAEGRCSQSHRPAHRPAQECSRECHPPQCAGTPLSSPAYKATLHGLGCKAPLRVNGPGTRSMFILASWPMFDGCSEVMLWPGTLSSPREPGGASLKAVEQASGREAEVKDGLFTVGLCAPVGQGYSSQEADVPRHCQLEPWEKRTPRCIPEPLYVTRHSLLQDDGFGSTPLRLAFQNSLCHVFPFLGP